MDIQQLDVLILLKKFSLKEAKNFHSYLKKQCRKDSMALKLYAYLRKYHPGFEVGKLSYEKAFRHLFPKAAFQQKTLSNVISDVRKLLRKYLIEQELEADAFLRNRILLGAYRKYQIESLFDKQLRILEKELAEEKEESIWSDFERMQLEHERYFFPPTKRLKAQDTINHAMEHLDRFYASAKKTYACELYNRTRVLDETTDIRLLPEVEEMEFEAPSAYRSFYKEVLELIKHRKEEQYEKVKTKFFAQSQSIDRKSQFIILSYLLNHMSHQLRKGKDNLIEEAFEFFQFGVQNEIFVIDGIFHTEHFLNAIEIASRLGHFDWAENLIVQWGHLLPRETTDYYKAMGTALILFKKKDYEACSDVLAKIDMKEPRDQLRGRWLNIISLYEANKNIDLTHHRCIAFRKFIRANSLISKEQKEGVLMAIKLMLMLLKIEPDKEKMKQLLAENKQFYYKSWLIDKVDQL